MNIHLVNFYKTWLHWATHENAENPMGFVSQLGLCVSLRRYCKWLGLSNYARDEIVDGMRAQFIEHGLSLPTPFNRDSDDYAFEPDKRKNPLRIQWCIDRIAEAEGHA